MKLFFNCIGQITIVKKKSEQTTPYYIKFLK
jgi:hypothetical protein